MDDYELTRAARMISDYLVDDVSNWYVRRNRRRFWKSEDWNDKLSAYETLYEVLITMAKLIAPYTPFIAEDIFSNLRNEDEPESVHLCDYPALTEIQKGLRDEGLEHRMMLVQKVVSLTHSLRNESNIRVRQPLSRLVISVVNENDRDDLLKMSVIICDELNIKKIEVFDSADDLVVKTAKANFKVLGPKVGKQMGKLAPIIQSFSRNQIDNFEKNGFERVSLDGQEIKLLPEDIEIRTDSKEGYATYTDADLTLALDLSLSDDLLEEGFARELINRIQNLRKDSGFSVTDRIEVYLDDLSVYMTTAIKNKQKYIMNETLAVDISYKGDGNLNLNKITIGDESLLIGLTKKENVQEV